MDKFIESREQRLCLMCGKCCRVSTTPKTYQELLKLVEEGDNYAKDFLEIFVPYSSIEDAKKVSAKTVENILKYEKLNGVEEKDVTFYCCKYILEDNRCGIYEKRPELCIRFPSSRFAVVPPGCGYDGWLFFKREELKKRIRKLKETILDLKAELPLTDSPEKIEKINQYIEKAEKTIETFSVYGSADW